MKKEKEKEKKRAEQEADEKRRSAMFRVETERKTDGRNNKQDLSQTDTNHLQIEQGQSLS